MKYLRRITTLFFLFGFLPVFSQETVSKNAHIKAIYIYNFTKYFEWPEKIKSNEFRIGVLGNDEDLIKELDKLAAIKKVGILPIKILKFSKFSEITQTEILIFDYKRNPELKIKKINKGTLLVTENDPDLNNIMLAFIKTDDNKLRFALNEINIKKSELNVADGLKNLSVDFKISSDTSNNEKTIKEYKSVFDKFSEALKSNASEIKLSKEEAAEVIATMDANKKTISEKEQKLTSQEVKLSYQEVELKTQQRNLVIQKDKIDEQLNSILTQEQKLKLQEQKLDITIQQNKAQEADLAIAKKEVMLQLEKIDNQKSILLNQQKDIDIQNKKLITQLGQINSQKTILYLAAFLVLVIAIALLVAYRGNKNKQKANALLRSQKTEIEHQRELVEEKQTEILDSINYAKRIQYSLLASDKLLNENLPEHFLFFKPKDVVSGDFYWGTKLNNENFALVTADSTGHGVPGAIMSMLNISCLNESIKENNIQPADILNTTRKKIIDHLSNDGSADGGKDGMDCSLVNFDFKNKKLTYAAANNPVWIVRKRHCEGVSLKQSQTMHEIASLPRNDGNYELIALPADRMPVGKHDRDSVLFTQREVELQSGDMVYTLTDGFPDQFGGSKGKKFKYKQLEELLISIAHESMENQKQTLDDVFETWKGNLEQVDDVCIIGVRV